MINSIKKFIELNERDIKIRPKGIILEKGLVPYYGEKDLIKSITEYYQTKIPIDVWYWREKVWTLKFTEEFAYWDCPNGTHYHFDGENLFPVCEFISGKKQKHKFKKLFL
jgi:hypothetical protein